MDFLYSLFFAAGMAGFAYTRMGRRVGYENAGYVNLIIGVVFVLSYLFFFTLLRFFLHAQ